MRALMASVALVGWAGCAAPKPPVSPVRGPRMTVHIASPVPGCGQGKLRVHFYDVGQALSALVDLPDGREILVDTGEDPKRPGCGAVCKQKHQHLMEKLGADLQERPLSLVWITHQHSDHIGGASDILEHFNVELYIDNGRDPDKPQIKRTHDAANARSIETAVVDPQHTASPMAVEDPLQLRPVVPPEWPSDCEAGKANPNECSIALRIDYCSSSVLFTGDAEDGEEAVLDTHGPVTLLQLAHHGSDTSSSDDFIRQTKPKYAVVSAGKRDEGMNRTYCHPRRSTLERVSGAIGAQEAKTLEAFDAVVKCGDDDAENHWSEVAVADHIWATERDGDIVLSTTGDGTFVRESKR